jgi:hypothetical protein
MRNNTEVLMTTFGTQLRPLNLKEGIFELTADSSATMDTPLADYIGTKKIFKAGSIVKGTFWEEATKDGKRRKVVMVMDGTNGRYLINKIVLKPTTQAEIDSKKSKEELDTLQNKVNVLLEEAKEEVQEVVDNPKLSLDKEYLGFTTKQILVASLGVIVLIKLFK